MPLIPQLQVLQNAIISGNVPQIVLASISAAVVMRASDIHIEPEEHIVRIRYRVDGALKQIVEYSTNIHPAVISRLKIMSNLKIDEQRMPQDGRAAVQAEDGRELDLRVSTLPTVNGEKICMRIQDKSRKIPKIEELGMRGNNLKFFKEAVAAPNGVILVTGPTGSGKTTTLYSCMQELNTEDVNIMTIEDPVEYQMDGLNQSQVHAEIDYTFSSGLRCALRQDPDIIMVGEIRDQETIGIAIQAALTGHQVFSTIHTNSAVSTLVRIADMKVKPYLITSALHTIVAQRLIRKICSECKEEIPLDEANLVEINKILTGYQTTPEDEQILANKKIFKGKGCDVCGGTGYKGRIGIYEIMPMFREVADLVLENAPSHILSEAAIKGGMTTLAQDGIMKVFLGLTTLEEVYNSTKSSV